MTALRIDNFSAFIEHVFRSKSTQLPVVRKLLLQCGVPLRDLFVINPTKGTAVAKNKSALKQTLIEMIQKVPTNTPSHTRKRKGGVNLKQIASNNGTVFIAIITTLFAILTGKKNTNIVQELQTLKNEKESLQKKTQSLEHQLNTMKEDALRVKQIKNVELSNLKRSEKRIKDKLASVINSFEQSLVANRKLNTKFETQITNLLAIISKYLPGITLDPDTKEPLHIPDALNPSKSKSKSFVSRAEELYNRLAHLLKRQLGSQVSPPLMFFFMIVSLAVVGYLQTKKRTRDPLQMAYSTYEQLLKQQGQLKVDPILARVKDTSSYEETKHCLRKVDQRLHRLCENYVHPDELRFHLLQLKTKREWFHGRSLLVEHLLRNDGEVRTTCSEIALAIAYHWKLRNLMGIVSESVKGTMRRKPMS